MPYGFNLVYAGLLPALPALRGGVARGGFDRRDGGVKPTRHHPEEHFQRLPWPVVGASVFLLFVVEKRGMIMFRTVFSKTLFDMRGALFGWALGMFGFSLLLMAFYPSMQDSAEDLQAFLDKMPKYITAMAGGEIDLTSAEGFLSARVSGTYPILALVFTIGYGVSLIAGEEESRTFELLLATPMPRWRVVIEKFAALVVFTVAVLVGSYLGLLAGALLVDATDEINEGRLLVGVLDIAPLALFFGALALCLAGLQRRRGVAMGLVVGFASISYLVNTMSTVTHIPLWMQRLSPWHYYNMQALREGVELGDVGLLLGLAALLVGVALWGFERRDVGV
jgi:ABC-2 type transport system permease protein